MRALQSSATMTRAQLAIRQSCKCLHDVMVFEGNAKRTGDALGSLSGGEHMRERVVVRFTKGRVCGDS